MTSVCFLLVFAKIFAIVRGMCLQGLSPNILDHLKFYLHSPLIHRLSTDIGTIACFCHTPFFQAPLLREPPGWLIQLPALITGRTTDYSLMAVNGNHGQTIVVVEFSANR